MSEHLLRQFVYTNVVSTQAFENDDAMVRHILEDHAKRDLAKQHLVIKSFTIANMPVSYQSDDGSIVDCMEYAMTGLAYSLDESADQTLRKMAIDEAVRGD